MRVIIIIIAVLFASACTLDPSSKPECRVDDDCPSGYMTGRGHCVERFCYPNVLPIGTPDVFYVLAGTDLSDGVDLEGNVVANDIDPEGSELKVYDVRNGAPGGSGYITKNAGTNVVVDVRAVPVTHSYRVSDETILNPDAIPISVAWLEPHVSVPIESGGAASLMPALGTLVDTGPGSIELVSLPAHGTLAGSAPDVTYTPDPSYCGTDSVTYRVHAANGTFDVVVTLDIGILLDGEQLRMEFGAPRTLDVLANDRSGLELVSTSASWAAITSAKDALIVDPPTSAAKVYTITYRARDARGCEGSATLTLDVGFPTSVVVGQGLAGDAFDAVLSHDGRFLAFTSADATLVIGDTNAASDVFVLDLQTSAIERVSIASSGAQANEGSSSPTISADGRYVAFVSRATNFVAADTTSVEDIYLHDRQTDATTLVSITTDDTGSDQPSLTPHISAAGGRVAFASNATKLVPSDTNDVMDIFVREVTGGTTARVSVTGSGAQVPFASYIRPRISGNGRYVVLSSSSSLDGSNSSGTFLVDTAGSAVSRIDSSAGEVDIDDTGRFVIQADYQVTLTDRVVENTTVFGTGTFPALSADGRSAVFVDNKTVVARSGTTFSSVVVDRAGLVVSATPLRRPEISGDGRWIVFSTSEWPGYTGRFVIVRVWNRTVM